MKTSKYIMLLAVAAVVGCTSDSNELLPGGNTETLGENVVAGSIESNYDVLGLESADESDVNETRAGVNTETFKAEWAVGDKISVTDGTLTSIFKNTTAGERASFGVIEEGSAATNMFSGDISSKHFYSVYPSAAVKGWSGSTASMVVYAEQDYTENMNGTFGGYMASIENNNTATNASFTYRLIGSIIDINLKTLGVTPASVSIKSNNGVSLSGDFKFDCAEGTTLDVQNINGTSYYATSQSDVVTVSNINEKVDYVRFYVLPVVITDGITVTVKDTEGNYYTKTTSATIGTAATGEGLTIQKNITGGTVAKPYYKKVNFGAASTATRKGNWMATVPSNIGYFMLSMPGTHNAAAYGSSLSPSTTRTTDLDLTKQLEAGVRAFDLRPYVTTDGQAYTSTNIYHGSQNTGVKFSDVMSTLSTFLTSNPTESIILIMHDEKGSNKWGTTVMAALEAYKDQIAKITTNMKLASLRGKMIVIVRDDVSTTDTDLCGKVGWGSSFGDKTVLKGHSSATSTGCTLRYQDEYTNDQYSNRLTNAVRMLSEIKNTYNGDYNRVFVNTLNTEWTLGGNSITTTAQKNNDAVINSTDFQNSDWRWGIILADYMGSDNYSGKTLANMVINQNFKYCFVNRTRRNATSATTGDTPYVSGDEYADEDIVYARPM